MKFIETRSSNHAQAFQGIVFRPQLLLRLRRKSNTTGNDLDHNKTRVKSTKAISEKYCCRRSCISGDLFGASMTF